MPGNLYPTNTLRRKYGPGLPVAGSDIVKLYRVDDRAVGLFYDRSILSYGVTEPGVEGA